MKIIYEVGDHVILEDNINVPHNLGADSVKLLKKLNNGDWSIIVVDSWGDAEGNVYVINEIWFGR